MAKQAIGLGSVANDGNGDDLRTGGDKINDNFDELYTALGDGTDLNAELEPYTTTEQTKLAGIATGATANSDESIQDLVGAMVTGNTETRITVTYQDADGTIDFVVDDDLANYSNATAGFLTGITGESIGDLPIDADIIPNADGTLDLGSAANRFAELHVDSIDLNGTTFTGATLTDPGADAIMGWDDSASEMIFFSLGTGLASSTTTLSVDSSAVVTGANVETAIEGLTLSAVTGATGDEVLVVDATDGGLKAVLWENLPGAGGGMTNFSLAGDSGTPQTIADGNTLDIAGGTGIATVAGATDTVTINVTGVLEDLNTLGAPASDGQFIVATGAGTFAYESTTTARTSLGAAALGANVFTGTQDFNGQQVEGAVNKVVTSVTGTLTLADHSGNVLVTSGNVTVPTTAGFNAVIIAGGAHTVTFNSTVSAAMATGDVMTVVVQSGTVIHAVLTAAANKVTFS